MTPHAVAGAVLLAIAQAGKPISPSGISIPKPELPKVPEILKPVAPRFQLPFFKKPDVPEAPQIPTLGPDGLTLTPAQRAEMAKNTDPYLKLGCDIGNGRAA